MHLFASKYEQNYTSSVEQEEKENLNGSNTDPLFEFLEDRLNKKIRTVSVDVIITKRQYIERINSSQDTNPLLFWKVLFSTLS